MSGRLPLCIVGGVFMIVSLFLPTLYCSHVSGEYFDVDIFGPFIYWMAGFFFTRIEESSTYGNYYVYHTDFVPDTLGIICMIIIFAGAILAFVLGSATEYKYAAVGGTLGLISLLIFFIGVNTGFPMTNLAELSNDGYFFIPFIGFLVGLVGSILALVGGILEKI